MKRSLARLLLAAAALGLAATAGLPAQDAPKPTRRVALLVGINEYQKRGFVNLRWAENDVVEAAGELRRLGFDRVVTMTGASAGELRPTRANIEARLTGLLGEVGKDDVVLMMLCGHGQQLAVRRADGTSHDDGFFCPADAVLNEPATMISLSRLTDETLHKWGGKNLVLVDACRDGVVDANRGVRQRGIQGRVVSLPEDTAMLFSCRAGQRSAERDDLKHGVFTHGVIETLRAASASGGAVTWATLIGGVQDRVAEMNGEQEPIAAGAIGRLVLKERRTVDVREGVTTAVGGGQSPRMGKREMPSSLSEGRPPALSVSPDPHRVQADRDRIEDAAIAAAEPARQGPPARKGGEPNPPIFRDDRIDEPYRRVLLANPVMTRGKGASRVLDLPGRRRMLLMVTGAPVKKPGATGRAEAEEICEMLALEQLAGSDGLQVQARRHLTDAGLSREVVARAARVVQDLPTVGTWLSVDGQHAYVARGVILEEDGRVVPDKAGTR